MGSHGLLPSNAVIIKFLYSSYHQRLTSCPCARPSSLRTRVLMVAARQMCAELLEICNRRVLWLSDVIWDQWFPPWASRRNRTNNTSSPPEWTVALYVCANHGVCLGLVECTNIHVVSIIINMNMIMNYIIHILIYIPRMKHLWHQK